MRIWQCIATIGICLGFGRLAEAAETPRPELPVMSGKVEIEVRDDQALSPAAAKPVRKLAVHLVYSRNRLASVKATTGVMLSLHNWGGTVWENTPNPNLLAEKYDLLVIGVTYYQSGDKDTDPEPYDFGYIQTMV